MLEGGVVPEVPVEPCVIVEPELSVEPSGPVEPVVSLLRVDRSRDRGPALLLLRLERVVEDGDV